MKSDNNTLSIEGDTRTKKEKTYKRQVNFSINIKHFCTTMQQQKRKHIQIISELKNVNDKGKNQTHLKSHLEKTCHCPKSE